MYKSKQTSHLWQKSLRWLARQFGDLSARMMHLEKFAEQAKADLDHLVEMQDAPITSDYQQFERLKYIEKELDRLRDKVEK